MVWEDMNMQEIDIVRNTIATSGGKLIDPFTMKANDGLFDIVEIAHALANQCRYSGHTRRHYSVAEHSLLVERVVAARGCGPKEQQWALVHDAEEAYLLDLPSPIKQRPEMAAYRAAGKRLMSEIVTWLGLEGEEPAIVKDVDVELRGTERAWLFPQIENWDTRPVIPGIACGVMTPEGARVAWLARFHELWPAWTGGAQ
jgi:hypothetical protein